MSNTAISTNTASTPAQAGRYTRWLDVTVSHLDESNTLRLTFFLTLSLNNGATKHSSKSIEVTDAVLQERLRNEVKPGDRIRICLETDWDDDDIPTVLLDFCGVQSTE